MAKRQKKALELGEAMATTAREAQAMLQLQNAAAAAVGGAIPPGAIPPSVWESIVAHQCAGLATQHASLEAPLAAACARRICCVNAD